MKYALVLLLAAFVAMSMIAIEADAQHNGHFQMGQCNCQRGGEHSGHCHCPDWAKMPNTYCRYGGNHWICFPWAG